MLAPIRIQRSTSPILAHNVGSLVICRYDGKDVLCVKTFLGLINLELPGVYFGILEHHKKTSKFEITKEIIAVDGELASFAINCNRKFGLKKYLRSVAPYEGTLCNEPHAYVITGKGEKIRVKPARCRTVQDIDQCGVTIDIELEKELPKGCPIYNKENKVIGLIRCKNHGILWFVSWFNESKRMYSLKLFASSFDFMR